jgi:hypothetical protein
MVNYDGILDKKHSKIMNTIYKEFEKSRNARNSGFYLESIIIDTQIITMHIILSLENNLRVMSFESDTDTIKQFKNKMLGTSEREIYRFAFVSGAIDEDCYKELNKFYTKRSNVVHRYIMNNISVEELKSIAHEDVNNLLSKIVTNYKNNIARLGWRLKLVSKEIEKRNALKSTKNS